jgi:hypothetical protein
MPSRSNSAPTLSSPSSKLPLIVPTCPPIFHVTHHTFERCQSTFFPIECHYPCLGLHLPPYCNDPMVPFI